MSGVTRSSRTRRREGRRWRPSPPCRSAQEDLAHGADLTTDAVSRIERAKMNPSWTTLQSILAALKADLADLQAMIERTRS
jgi:DNA-binding XRE family transcriptional regulator